MSGTSRRFIAGVTRPARASGLLATSAPPESASIGESARLTASELGARDAVAGVPDPVAESSDDQRQPVGALELLSSHCLQAVNGACAAGLHHLRELSRLDAVMPRSIRQLEESLHAREYVLREVAPARERHLAHWRFTALVLAIALALPFEVYLTSLSLGFLDVGDAWAVRLLSLGIAISLTLTGLITAQLGRDGRGYVWRNGALWFLVLLVLALATLRYGVMARNNALWEQAGALVALAASAAAFALWVAFADSRIHRAQQEQERWEARSELEHQIRSERAQVALLEERLVGLPAEVSLVRDAAVSEIARQGGAFDLDANDWWASNQRENPAAAPDIRPQRERLREKVRQAEDNAVRQVDDCAASVAATIAGDTSHSSEA